MTIINLRKGGQVRFQLNPEADTVVYDPYIIEESSHRVIDITWLCYMLVMLEWGVKYFRKLHRDI
jgi:hypothetical protein